jgi:hypothetical protein
MVYIKFCELISRDAAKYRQPWRYYVVLVELTLRNAKATLDSVTQVLLGGGLGCMDCCTVWADIGRD